jgi:hypothetical protein
MKKIPDGTWVQIRKPNDSDKNWTYNQYYKMSYWKDSIYWNPEMDEFNNKFFTIKSMISDNYIYILNNNKYKYEWHADWFVIADIDKNGNPIPIDNQGRRTCYWCEEKTKTRYINFEYENYKGYTYCPKCSR